MDSLDRKPFATELLKLAEAFGTKVSEARAEAYFDALMEFDVLDIRAACQRAIREKPHFPRVSELIELARAIRADQRINQPKPERIRQRCGPTVACQDCEIIGCQCQGCIEAIAKCRAEFAAIAEKAGAGALFLMRIPPPPTRELSESELEEFERKKHAEIERLERAAIEQEDEPF